MKRNKQTLVYYLYKSKIVWILFKINYLFNHPNILETLSRIKTKKLDVEHCLHPSQTNWKASAVIQNKKYI